MDYTNKLLFSKSVDEIKTIAWQSPSNIALVKYWGKKDFQLPQNPSISLTLRNSRTEMVLKYRINSEQTLFKLQYYFEGIENQKFKSRIEKFLNNIIHIFPFINQMEMEISSHNTFPHSSGIASSASALSALALCLCSVEKENFGTLQSDNEFFTKASFVSRLGSGSASRSVYGKWAIWGECDSVKGSSDNFAVVPDFQIHPVFENLHDAILIVSSGEKSVSSSLGHDLMNNHPFAEKRFLVAEENLKKLIIALKTGDFTIFARIVENEALMLHGLMMSSDPSYLLMKHNTITIVEKIRKYFKQNHINVCFTLDAGPNVHLLYPNNEEVAVKEFIRNELEQHCENSVWIDDLMGEGPLKLI